MQQFLDTIGINFADRQKVNDHRLKAVASVYGLKPKVQQRDEGRELARPL